MDKDDILRKLKKILKAEQVETAHGNTAAAEAYATRASELLLKYKIERSEIETEEDERKDPVTYKIIQPGEYGEDLKPEPDLFIVDIATTLGEGFFCKVIYYENNNAFAYVGRESDIDIATYIFVKFIRAASAQCETEIAETLLTPQETFAPGSLMEIIAKFDKPQVLGDDYRKSFLHGVNETLRRRIYEQLRKGEKQAAAAGSTALVKATADVETFIKEVIKCKEETPEQRKKEIIDYVASRRGAHFGNTADISANGLNNSDENKLIGD